MVLKPTIFLDRDGVLNVDVGYAHRPEQIVWVEGVFRALSHLKVAGIQVIVVTNQSGVARGYYTEDDVIALHAWMGEQIAQNGGNIEAFYYCPYHPQATIAEYRRDHPDRKPGPGMILRAMVEHSVDPEKSWLIGDRDSDLVAAQSAGLPGFMFAGGNLDLFVDRHLDMKSKRLLRS